MNEIENEEKKKIFSAMLDAIETNEVNKLWMKLIDSVKLCCASASNVHNGNEPIYSRSQTDDLD